MKKIQLLILTILFSFSVKAQDIAMNSSSSSYDNMKYNVSKTKIVPLLEESTYTYKYKGENVEVVFTEDKHIEYFNNKKYFIKSKIEWTANDECYMTIEDSNLPNFPFRSGVKLLMKIVKIKRGYIHYESTLAGKTWTGKMKQL